MLVTQGCFAAHCGRSGALIGPFPASVIVKRRLSCPRPLSYWTLWSVPPRCWAGCQATQRQGFPARQLRGSGLLRSPSIPARQL